MATLYMNITPLSSKASRFFMNLGPAIVTKYTYERQRPILGKGEPIRYMPSTLGSKINTILKYNNNII